MKALLYTGPRTVQLTDLPTPQAGPDEVRIRVEAVGICGSELHGFLGHDPRRLPPLVMGHEAAGTVLDGALAGQRVVFDPLVTCGTCAACLAGHTNLCDARVLIGMGRPGAMAEVVVVPQGNLVEVPATLDPTHAALAEPLATGVHALRLATRWDPVPRRALVLGGGSVGLLAALLLRHQGVDVQLHDTNPLRAGTAARAGLPGLSAQGFDLVVDAVGVAATRQAACGRVRPGGCIVHIGLGEATGGVDARRLTLAEIALIGSYTYTRADIQRAVSVLADGALGPLDWVDARPLSAGQASFEELVDGRAAAPKILLLPGDPT